MGQQASTGLEKYCCNNNLCNFDSNVENITEVNRRNNSMGMGNAHAGPNQNMIAEDLLMRAAHGGSLN